MIKRIYDLIELYKELNNSKKVILIYGPRQVGKSTLLNKFLASTDLKYRLITGEDIQSRNILLSMDLLKITTWLEGIEVLAIDEAQMIPNIGASLKLIHDHTATKCIATGSSSFELNQQIGEPLVGRKSTINLYPISLKELENDGIFGNKFDLMNKMEEFLIWGMYPEILMVNNKQQKSKRLSELTDSYLLKDLLVFDKVKSSMMLINLLKLLALQIGSEVSVHELAQKLGSNQMTIGRYLDLLEKTFVIKKISAYSNNPRKEVTKKSKYYFFDVGIRNAIITNFNSMDKRNDVGALWENYLVMERIKKIEYSGIIRSLYFWRTYDQKEIDLIETGGEKNQAYEFKWSETATIKKSSRTSFLELYPNTVFNTVSPKEVWSFI